MKSTAKAGFCVALVLASFASAADAAELVNINTADSATLQTLDGIGPSKAAAVIDYRTQNGPFQTIADIQNVSGIGPTTYANIKDYITVGDVSQAPATPSPGAAATSTQSAYAQPSASAAQVPALLAKAEAPAAAVVGEGAQFSGQAYSHSGVALDAARYIWNFGDGATAEGQSVLHSYAYPGTYAVVLTVASGYSSGEEQVLVKVIPADLALIAENDGSLLVVNNTPQLIDIGRWALACGTQAFFIPAQTRVLAGGGVRFSPSVTGFTCGTQAQLHYPQGTLAVQASLSADSPLHGQAVSPSELHAASVLPAKPAPASTKAAPATHADTQSAAAALSIGQSPYVTWGAGAVGATLMVVAAGLWLEPGLAARLRRAKATDASADEFEIEE